jgi:hypothetical protein
MVTRVLRLTFLPGLPGNRHVCPATGGPNGRSHGADRPVRPVRRQHDPGISAVRPSHRNVSTCELIFEHSDVDSMKYRLQALVDRSYIRRLDHIYKAFDTLKDIELEFSHRLDIFMVSICAYSDVLSHERWSSE